jgi:site-specific DNA-adenine methylase
MEDRYGLVYLGSKEKILHLIDYILHREQDKDYFIDLFAGGLSVSAFVLKHSNMRVLSNDLNKYIIAFYEEILSGGVRFKNKKFDWIDRKLFTDVRDYPEFYEDWYVGYVLNIWSFGCNQKDYLYAKDLEQNKKALHQAIVFKDYSYMNDIPLFNGFYNTYIKNHYVEEVDYKKHSARRVLFMERFKKFIEDNKKDKEKYEELLRLEMIVNLSLLEKVDAIFDLIKHKERITLFNDDWQQTLKLIPKEILEKSVIYCDPPYEDAKQYQVGGNFNYFEFWKWFRECPYPVYVSSYKAPRDLEPINFEPKVQLLDNGHRGDKKPKKTVNENIYWNGKGNQSPTLLDMLFGK